jgi:hypothetical protein
LQGQTGQTTGFVGIDYEGLPEKRVMSTLTPAAAVAAQLGGYLNCALALQPSVEV